MGPTAKDLDLPKGSTEAELADFLSEPEIALPKTFILENVQFAYNKDELSDESYDQLFRVVRILKAYPTVKVEVNGHTDSRGSEERNQQLSQTRANRVKDYLVDQLIEPERITRTVGYGASQPVADNDSENGMQQNRRCEVVVVAR